jgi:hypothetical protein
MFSKVGKVDERDISVRDTFTDLIIRAVPTSATNSRNSSGTDLRIATRIVSTLLSLVTRPFAHKLLMHIILIEKGHMLRLINRNSLQGVSVPHD